MKPITLKERLNRLFYFMLTLVLVLVVVVMLVAVVERRVQPNTQETDHRQIGDYPKTARPSRQPLN